MHIYPWQIHLSPLLQLSIDVCKTITPNQFHIDQNAHVADGYHPQSSIALWQTISPKQFHLDQHAHVADVPVNQA